MVSSRAQKILTFLLIDQLFGDVSTTNNVGVLIAHMLVYYYYLTPHIVVVVVIIIICIIKKINLIIAGCWV